ncbi:MAG: hypothetical protein HQK49_16860 [Oligoflexia bacterium]|nr:hypothetical protein [Oligoflexia bacterium]
MHKLYFILLFVLLGVIFSSCNIKESTFIMKLNEYDRSNWTFSVAKSKANDPTGTGQHWFVVRSSRYDENHPDLLVEERFIAYNITNFTDQMSFQQYLATLPIDGIRTDIVPIGGDFYMDSSNGNIFEELSATPKDLEKVGALKEEFIISSVREQIIGEFGLSQERGEKIAKLIYQWNTLSKKRQMSSDDLANIGKEILGFDFKKFQQAFNGGDRSVIDELIKIAALKNNISPEQVNKILNNLVQ